MSDYPLGIESLRRLSITVSHSKLHMPVELPESNKPIPKRGRRWRWILISGVIEIILAEIVYDVVARIRLANAMAEAVRDTPAWTLEGLEASWPDIPDHENSALLISETIAEFEEKPEVIDEPFWDVIEFNNFDDPVTLTNYLNQFEPDSPSHSRSNSGSLKYDSDSPRRSIDFAAWSTFRKDDGLTVVN